MTQSNDMPDELEIGVFYAPAPMSEHFMSVIDADTKMIPEKKARYKKVECRSVFMPEGDVIEIPITAPCGDEITIKEQDGNRTYWYKGKMIWNPQEVHRVGLLTVMLKEDELRYKEKQERALTPPQSPNRAVLDALHWIVTNGNFTEEQTNDLTEKMRIVEAAATQADEVKVIPELEPALMNATRAVYEPDKGEYCLWCGDKEHAEAILAAAEEHLKRQKGR